MDVSFQNSWTVHPFFAFGVCQLLDIVTRTSKIPQNGCRLLEIVNCTPTPSLQVALKWMSASRFRERYIHITLKSVSASRIHEPYIHFLLLVCVSFSLSWTVHPNHPKMDVGFSKSWTVHPPFRSRLLWNGCQLPEIKKAKSKKVSFRASCL